MHTRMQDLDSTKQTQVRQEVRDLLALFMVMAL